LGLDYNELRSIGDDVEVLRRIVHMACGIPDSTIEDHEERLIAADIAEWVLEHEQDGYLPTPEEIVRQTIAVIIAEVLLVESGNLVNGHSQADVAESDIRDAAEAIAAQAVSVGQAMLNELNMHSVATTTWTWPRCVGRCGAIWRNWCKPTTAARCCLGLHALPSQL
jgi:hypothetical protein